MAIGAALFGLVGGAVQDIFGGNAQADGLKATAQGARIEATNYGMAADLALKNKDYTAESTAIQVMQQERTNYQEYSGVQSDVAAGGLRASGSALDILRDNAAQGALSVQVLQKNGAIAEEGYKIQSQTYKNMQKAALYKASADEQAAKKASSGGKLGGILKGVAAVASIFL